MLKKSKKADLRAKYMRYVETAVIISLSLLIVAFKYFPDIKTDFQIAAETPELIKATDILPTTQERQLPKPPDPQPVIEMVDDDIPADDIDFGPTDLTAPVDPVGPPKFVEKKKEEVEESPWFEVVETMPEPIGGIAELQQKVVYPEFAIRAGIQGKVTVLAWVEPDGSVARVELVKGIGMGCDEAAMQAVMQTRFSPGKQRGKPVRTKVSVPIRFRLK